MKQKVIGIYDIGPDQCELVLREGTGGEFYFVPETGRCSRIKVGADYTRWVDVVECLLHETLELTMTRKDLRYMPTGDMRIGHDQYTFIMTHPEFSDVCGRAAEYLAAALPDLAAAWKKWHHKSGGK